MNYQNDDSARSDSLADDILFLGQHEAMGILNRETAARNFAAWATGLLTTGDMHENSPFTIFASMDLANNVQAGCEAFGAEQCDCGRDL
jgi:hypothetical protein